MNVSSLLSTLEKTYIQMREKAQEAGAYPDIEKPITYLKETIQKLLE